MSSNRQVALSVARWICPRAAFLVGAMGAGSCIFPVDKEEPWDSTKSGPVVVIYDYSVTRVDNGASLGTGCTAFNLGFADLAAAIRLTIPLDIEYEIEYASAVADGEIATRNDVERFCSGQVQRRPSDGYVAPTCYRNQIPAEHELVSVRVVDALGNPYTVPAGNDSLTGHSGDRERFRLRSHVVGPVILDRYSPCPPASDGSQKPSGVRTLLTVQP